MAEKKTCVEILGLRFGCFFAGEIINLEFSFVFFFNTSKILLCLVFSTKKWGVMFISILLFEEDCFLTHYYHVL